MSLFELVDKFKELSDLKEMKEEELKTIKDELDFVKYQLANEMVNEETQNITRKGFTYSLVMKTKYSKQVGKEQELFDVLTNNGLQDIIKPTVNANTLNSAINELVSENGGELPDDFKNVLNVYEFSDISKRKKQ